MKPSSALPSPTTSSASLIGYRVEMRPGDYSFYRPESYHADTYLAGTPAWEMHDTPQTGYSDEIVVYLGPWWVQPKHVYGRDLKDFKPCYLGRQVERFLCDPELLYLFPGLLEEQLMVERPDLYLPEKL